MLKQVSLLWYGIVPSPKDEKEKRRTLSLTRWSSAQEKNRKYRVDSYDKVFTIDDNRIISMIKVRVIQAMIQIARPVAWGVGRTRGLALELKCIELYNSAIAGKKEATRLNWENIT